MYKYSTTLEGDEIVEKDMLTIKEAIASDIANTKVLSAVLYGAFGRGEGLVLDGKPRNDYDILIVHPQDKIGDIKKKIEELKLNNYPEVLLVGRNDINDTVCTQQWFEIKYASQLLGGDPLNLPNWKPYDIPFIDAINSLDRRSVSMLIAKWEMGKEEPDERKITEQINKGIIAVGDATLIKRGQFNPKYANRALMLSQDDISPLYQIAVTTKLFGYPEIPRDNLWTLWNRTRDLMREFVTRNQVNLVIGEFLFQYNDTVPREELKKMLIELGAKKWL